MRSSDPKPSIMKFAILTAVGLVVFIIYLYFFVGFNEILDVLEQVDPVEYTLYYSLTFAAILMSVLFYSMTWHELMKPLTIDVGLRRAFQYCLLSNFVDLVIPLEAVTGEFTRIYLLSRDSNLQIGMGVASIVSHRIISNLFALGALVVSSLALFRFLGGFYVSFLLSIVIAGTSASILILFYLSVRDNATGRLINKLVRLAEFISGGHLRMVQLRDKVEENLTTFHKGFMTLRDHPSHLIKPVIYTSISWVFHLVIYFLVFHGLGYRGGLLFIPQMVVVFSISIAAQTIPIGLPVGIVEIVMTSLYTLFGIPPALGGTATTLIRVVTFWFQIIVGYMVAQWMGIKILSKADI